MKLAITGATGFIGRHVVAELDRRSISAVLACRQSPAIPSGLERHTLVHLDLNDPSPRVFDALDRPDVLVHLAWGGLPNYMSLHHYEEQLPLHYGFLKRMIESGLANLLVTGTCFEYGMRSGPLREDCESSPATPYGFAKDMLRRQLEYLRQKKPFNLTWARLFYVYGQGQAESSLLPQLRKAADKGDPTFNMSGGEQLRDYLPVEDVAGTIVSLALSPRANGLVNVCSGIPVSVRKLVERWIAENSWNIQLNLGYYPYPSYEPLAFWGDRTKLDCCMGIR